MSKTMLLCSGQGSQYEGMGKQLLALCPEVEAIYQCGSDITGMDLKQLCLEADAATLAQTKISQPAIFTTSLVALKAMERPASPLTAPPVTLWANTPPWWLPVW